MKITQVMVEFEKRVNDGNYGSENATVQYVAALEEDEDPDDVIRELIARGRQRVVGQLSASESFTVRTALNPPAQLCSECGETISDQERREHGSYHGACIEARDERYKRDAEARRQRLIASGREFYCEDCNGYHSGPCVTGDDDDDLPV